MSHTVSVSNFLKKTIKQIANQNLNSAQMHKGIQIY